MPSTGASRRQEKFPQTGHLPGQRIVIGNYALKSTQWGRGTKTPTHKTGVLKSPAKQLPVLGNQGVCAIRSRRAKSELFLQLCKKEEEVMMLCRQPGTQKMESDLGTGNKRFGSHIGKQELKL